MGLRRLSVTTWRNSAINPSFNTLGRDSLHLWIRWLAAALRNDARRLCGLREPSRAMPAQALIGVTYRCDSRCSHCAIWADYLKQPELAAQEMTLAEFEQFLDRNPQLTQVVTTGGEQFCREDIVDLWLAMDRRGQRTSCATNAIEADHIIERETFLLSRLSGHHLRNLGVSMDGAETVHDRIRGVKGNFASAWRLFQWAREQEQRHPFYRAEISSTLTADNWREFPGFVEWLIAQGVPPHKIGFILALPSAHYYQNEKSFKPVAAPCELADMMNELKRKHTGFASNYYTENYLRWLRDPSSGVACMAGTAFAYVDPYWNVYPCLVLDRRLGNLREYDFDLRELWRTDAARQFRADLAAEPCTLCFNECNRWTSARATTLGLARIALRQAKKLFGRSTAQRRWRM
ncbi:MAG: radical SAM protein [Verrucomicrobia bacterium]|nr:radical SAM protein [Verrucomicrobiota bacterium]